MGDSLGGVAMGQGARMSYAGSTRVSIHLHQQAFLKKLGHRVKPGDDYFFPGHRKVPPESGWIATISKPIFGVSIKLKMEPQDWSQP